MVQVLLSLSFPLNVETSTNLTAEGKTQVDGPSRMDNSTNFIHGT